MRERRKQLIITGFFLLIIAVSLLSFAFYKGLFSSQRKSTSSSQEKKQKEWIKNLQSQLQEFKNQQKNTTNLTEKQSLEEKVKNLENRIKDLEGEKNSPPIQIPDDNDDEPEQEPKKQSPIAANELDKLINKQTEKPYFAYGLDMHTSEFKTRVGAVGKKYPAALANHSLAFNKKKKNGSLAANIQQDQSYFVYGTLYFGMNKEKFAKLDKSQGVATGHYQKTVQKVWVPILENNEDFKGFGNSKIDGEVVKPAADELITESWPHVKYREVESIVYFCPENSPHIDKNGGLRPDEKLSVFATEEKKYFPSFYLRELTDYLLEKERFHDPEHKKQKNQILPYFAYGSNMSEAQMRQRCPDWANNPNKKATPAYIIGWKLVFNKKATKGSNRGSGYANIVQAPNTDNKVHGILYEGLSESDYISLAKNEGINANPPHYRKWGSARVNKENEPLIKAVVYIAEDVERLDNNLKPKREYLNKLLAGKKYLPTDYYQMLTKIETVD